MNERYVKTLRNGGVGVLLTDTLYGIVGSALQKKVVQRIYEIKGRDENKPFIILISKISDLKLFGIVPTREDKQILNTYWPGPVSIILKCKEAKFAYLHRGTKSLAFRLPSKKSLVSLLQKIGPLVAPSANPQGSLPAKNITEARAYFGNNLDFYFSGGRPREKPSKLLKFDPDGLKILRK